MKILYLSNIEWSDDNASGNTASNWFAGMKDMEFASIYRRNSMPNNSVCDKYYQITMTSIIKKFFHKEKIGKDISQIKGSGAAGGLGAGFLAFTNASLQSGIDLLLDLTKVVYIFV